MRALVLHPALKFSQRASGQGERRRPEARLDEAVGLAQAIDLDVIHAELVTVSAWRPATLIGPGKVEELAARIAESPVDVVIVDAAVSPVQQRNLERARSEEHPSELQSLMRTS